MNSTYVSVAVVVLGSMLVAGVAGAQEKDQSTSDGSSRLESAAHSVELTIGTGYAQGLGDVASGQPSLTDVGQAGGAVQAGVGYRIIPQLTLGVYGSGAMFGRGAQVDDSTNLYSASAGVQTDWHFLPAHNEIDPWVSLGTGWRGYWAHSNVGETSLQGMDLARLQVGLDYRIDQAVAISPVVGASLTTFFEQATPTSNGFSSLSSPDVSTFVFAGVQGRFDVPTGSRSSQVASR